MVSGCCLTPESTFSSSVLLHQARWRPPSKGSPNPTLKVPPLQSGPGCVSGAAASSVAPLLGNLEVGSDSTARPVSGVWSPRGSRAGSHSSCDLSSQERDRHVGPTGGPQP